METRKKKKTMNIIMAVLIAVVIFCGVMAVGALKGWFGGSDSPVVSDSISGVVNIERNGVAYGLDENISMEKGDIVETKNISTAQFKLSGKNMMAVNELSEFTLKECSEENITVDLAAGEIFADIPEAKGQFRFDFGGNTAAITGTVFSISAQQGSSSISVYEGTVDVTAADGSRQTVKSGEMISIVQQSDGNIEIEKTEMKADTLNDFIIGMAQSCDSKKDLCFTQDELQKVLDDRAKEAEAAQDADGDVISASGSKSDGKSGSKSSGKTNSKSDSTAAVKDSVSTCTIQIRCDTILSNMENLTPGKERYVPSNGIILATSTVEFAEGETVFDVLNRACKYAGIHLEYAYTPLYESYYIEGINNLYEFDCGEQSGWMYKVNGWHPNYGCSSYVLEDGDNIVWSYTCNGLGADVGGNVR